MDKQAWLNGAEIPDDAPLKRTPGTQAARRDARCIHCGQPFSSHEGYIGAEVSLCDRCNGD